MGQDFVRRPTKYLSYDYSRFADRPRLIVKETWEPTIEDLFVLDDKRPEGPLIREVWGLDCQNHGEACILNEDVLARNPGILSMSIRIPRLP